MALVVRPARRDDLAAMTEIYNQGIRDGIATFETRERTADQLAPWLDDPAHPVLVTSGDAGTVDGAAVLGWVAASAYRPRACYDGVAEFSVYVAREARGRGVGHALMAAFLPACEAAGLWKLLSRVFPENAASRALLARHGFREVGTYQRHARHRGAWRDVVIVERLLGAALADVRAAQDAGNAGDAPDA